MTLEKLLTEIANKGIQEKLVNYSAAGITLAELNDKTITDYPVLFTAPNGSHTIQENTTTYNLAIFFIDRLLEGSENNIQILSVSIEQLKNVIKAIEEIDDVVSVSTEYDIQNFVELERLTDRCAGSYAYIKVTVQNSTLCHTDE